MKDRFARLAAVGLLGCLLAAACAASSSPTSGNSGGGASSTSSSTRSSNSSSSTSSAAGSTSGASSSSASGSSTSSGGGPAFSCDSKSGTTHVCEEYDNVPAGSVASLQSTCAAEMGTAGTGCSSANRIGVCTGQPSSFTVKESYYTDSGLTAAQAQMDCTAEGGTWTPG